MSRRGACVFLVTLCIAGVADIWGQAPDAPFFAGLRWRLVGPNRAGRVWTVAGVPGDPATYYIGTPAGGLWKSTTGGTTWVPASAGIPVTGIGVVAVSPSRPDTVYVGTGSNTIGDGVYRSDDGGGTWRNVGLSDTKYITALLVHPSNPDIVLAGAGSGGNFGSMVFYNNNPSAARGVHRTADGGRTWTHTLFVDDQTSVVDLTCDPAAPATVFASLAASGAAQAGPPIYRSDDGGSSWRTIAARGLPRDAVSANIVVAPGTGSRRLYALTGGRGSRGLYRSDDAGETFALATNRTASAGVRLYVDPSNPDIVYTMGTSMYRSTDGGRTLATYKGAPGGDDATALWIDPRNPKRMILGADQGPSVSVDGGRTWTPWYTVPNGEHYFVSTDNQFPYWIYAAQQDSGTVAIRSRSDFGAIRPNDWYPVSGYEQGHIFADPFQPRYVYSHGDGHAIVRFDRETGQSGPVYTPSVEDRFGPRPGMEMSPKDPHWMFVGAQYVLASDDRVTWKKISPDLTVRSDAGSAPTQPGAPAQPGARPARGTIVALAPSPIDLDVLWAGTSNGLVHVTRDRGKTWSQVSPPRLFAEPTLTLWSLEASPHDVAVAYAAAIDLSDRRAPCLLRTADFGRTWQEIVSGLPVDIPTRVVREDPVDPRLLYAGTQAGIFVSFDTGRGWQPLQLNLPTVSVNDITVHGSDVVIATWGRGLWVLDDVSPLRQIDAAKAAGQPFFFAPHSAVRVRWSNNRDTPLPPEVPTGQNPPDGAILYYYLPSATPGPLALTVRDAEGRIVREYSSAPAPACTAMPNVPEYWFKTPEVLDGSAGLHRFVWDLRYPTPPSLNYGADGNPASSASYGIVAPAILGQTPRQQPIGPLGPPGTYLVSLAVGERTLTRELVVTNDPRVAVAPGALSALVGAQLGLAAGIRASHDAIEQGRALRQAAAERTARAGAGADARGAAETFERATLPVITKLAGARSLVQLLESLEFADLAPTESTVSAIAASCARADEALSSYRELVGKDLGALNAALVKAGQAEIQAPAAPPARACVPVR